MCGLGARDGEHVPCGHTPSHHHLQATQKSCHSRQGVHQGQFTCRPAADLFQGNVWLPASAVRGRGRPLAALPGHLSAASGERPTPATRPALSSPEERRGHQQPCPGHGSLTSDRPFLLSEPWKHALLRATPHIPLQ